MDELEIRKRLNRIRAALGDVNDIPQSEIIPPVVHGLTENLHIEQTFSTARTPEQLEVDAFAVIDGIMGLKDRARAWLKKSGKDPNSVETFIKSEQEVGIIQELGNADKHGKSSSETFSGLKPRLVNINTGVVLKRDPVTGRYLSTGTSTINFDFLTGKVEHVPSDTTELVLTGEIVDEFGNHIETLHDALFRAIIKWEDFLNSQGMQSL